MVEQTAEMDPSSVSIARQPVFDRNGRLWGYDLFCTGVSEAAVPNAAACMASGASIHLKQILQGGRKVMVDFSVEDISGHLAYAMPTGCTVIKVRESLWRFPESIEALTRLKKEGYLIAVAGWAGHPECEPLLRLADIIVIEAQQKDKDRLQSEIALVRPYRTLVLADRVQARPLYDICRELDFSLFCGPYFKYPDTMTARKLSSMEVMRFKILSLLERSEAETSAIAEVVGMDVTISFRLLTFLNSAAFAFSQRIKSIQHAVTLLGWQKVRNWLRVILLTDMNQSADSGELVLLSAQRGMFLELVARDHDFWGFDPGSLHLLGLFSLLDALLRMPMTEIVGYLPIHEKMKRALCREPDSEYLPLMRLAQCFEEGLWNETDAMVQQLNLDRTKVRLAFRKSLEWSAGVETLQSGAPGSVEK